MPIVRLRNSGTRALADVMAEMRDWFDHNKIETVYFRGTTREIEVRFQTLDDANRFRRAFAGKDANAPAAN